MARKPRISAGEWEVMEVLWDGHPLPSGEIVAALAATHGRHPKTVRTLLGRLVSKGCLSFERAGKGYRYSPTVSRAACVREESESLVERVFAGDVKSALLHFVESAELSPGDLAELRSVLERRGEAE